MWNDPNGALVATLWADVQNGSLDPETVNFIFQVAHEVCLAYASPLAEGAQVPANYLMAEILQAKDIWSKTSGGNSSEFGADGYAIPTYPLVFAARDLLRPKTSPLGRLR